MRKYIFIMITAILIAAHVPALALQIVDDPVSTPSLVTPVMDSAWTANLQDSIAISNPVVPAAVSTVVVPTGSWVQRPIEPVIKQSYIKTPEDMKVMNIQVYNNPEMSPVPEPGSIAGLSAGLAGLAFQVRRFRRR